MFFGRPPRSRDASVCLLDNGGLIGVSPPFLQGLSNVAPSCKPCSFQSQSPGSPFLQLQTLSDAKRQALSHSALARSSEGVGLPAIAPIVLMRLGLDALTLSRAPEG